MHPLRKGPEAVNTGVVLWWARLVSSAVQSCRNNVAADVSPGDESVLLIPLSSKLSSAGKFGAGPFNVSPGLVFRAWKPSMGSVNHLRHHSKLWIGQRLLLSPLEQSVGNFSEGSMRTSKKGSKKQEKVPLDL